MPEQVGGLQDVFIQLSGTTLEDIESTITFITHQGGRVRHVLPPKIVVASMPPAKVGELVGHAGIVAADTEALPGGPHEAVAAGSTGGREIIDEAVAVWNQHVSAERTEQLLAASDLDVSWDTPDKHPPHPPEEIAERIAERERTVFAEAVAEREAGILGGPVWSIPVLVGRIGVGVVFVDSPVDEYKITDAEKGKIVSEISEGLNQLSGFEPRADIQWFYDYQRPSISLTASSFPAGQENNWENTWRNAAMQAMGYTANINGMNAYINHVKTTWNAQWAYAVFVTKYPKDWFAYYWGNHVVMDFGVDGWGIDNFNRVLAHETGHVFGCADEYAASNCNCTTLCGRYQVPNGNCEKCNPSSIPCLMKANTLAICDYSRGALGWNELAVQSKGTTTLKGTWTFDFDSGIQGPAGGADIWWEQVNNVTRYLVPQSGAVLRHMGTPDFDSVSYQTLQSQAYTATPVDGSNNGNNQLPAGSVIAVRTNAGRYAKMKVNSYGYNLGITWVTYK